MPVAERGSRAASVRQRIRAIRGTDVKRWWRRRLPITEWAPRYSFKENLLPDAVSGLMLAVHQVAQGLAFAVMSSVHPVFGLYGSLIPPFVYAIIGMGRHVATGTFALTSLISAGAVERLVPRNNNSLIADNNSGVLGLSEFEMQRIGVAAAVTLLGGVIQVAMFVLQLGSVTFLMTESMISAMTTGAATHGVNALVKHLLGLKMPFISGPLGMFYIYAYVFNNIHSVQLEALLLSLLSIVLLLIIKKTNEKYKKQMKIILPIDLFLMIAGSLACYFADMEHTYGLDVVGHIPKGIPPPRAPPLNILSVVIIEGLGMAFAGYAASLVLAHGSAKKYKYYVDDNQELLAHGLSNVIPSFFYCIPSAAAMGRTRVLYENGARTQVASLISCAVILILIFVVGPLLYWLPMCVLASVVVVALKGMLMQFLDLRKYWKADKIDCVLWICTYVVTICFAASVGLLFGIIFNIAIAVGRLTRAKTFHFQNVEEEEWKVLENLTCERSERVKIVSIDTPLFFLNAKKFHADLVERTMKNSAGIHMLNDTSQREQNKSLMPLSREASYGNSGLSQTTCCAIANFAPEEATLSKPYCTERGILILDCKGLTFFDYTGVSTLVQVYMDLKTSGVDVLLVHCRASLIRALQCGGLETENSIFFKSVSSAVGMMHLHKACSQTLVNETDV